MFAISFDLTVATVEQHHPKAVARAYSDIRATLNGFGFERIQGSVYVCDSEDLGNLFDALDALKPLPWFPPAVRDIRAFRVEQWSDFTDRIKRQ